MEIKEIMTDEAIIAHMKQSTSVEDWNNRRDRMKAFRSDRWIATNLDRNGLIIQILGKDKAHAKPSSN